MSKVTDYTIIYAGLPHKLADRVKYYLEKGWQPIGGVSVVWDRDNNSLEYCQALVLY